MGTTSLAGGIRIAWANTQGTPRRQVSRELLRSLLGENSRGHSLTAHDLPATTTPAATFIQECPVCGAEDHGPLRVLVPDAVAPLVSVSYAGQFAVVACAPAQTRAFGIDAEFNTARTRAAIAESLASIPFDQYSSTAAVYTWTRLEAIAKARGTGLRGEWELPDPSGFEFIDHVLPTTPEALFLSVAIQR